MKAKRTSGGEHETAVSSEWPGIIGIDLPEAGGGVYEAKRVVCQNPDYQPKPIVKSQRIERPVFKVRSSAFGMLKMQNTSILQ